MFLKPLRVLFGLPGALLGASWSLLGRLGTKLGWSWGYFWGTLIFDDFFGMVLGAKRIPKRRHLGSQNGAKIDKKKRCKFKSEKVTSWSRLGAILDRFPRRLGVKHVEFSFVLKVFVKKQRF